MSTGRLRHPGARRARAAASTPTPCRSTPIAAPGGRRRPTCSSGWSTRAAARPASAATRSAGAISSGREQLPYARRAAALYDSGEFAGHIDRGAGARRTGRASTSARGSSRSAARQDPRHRPRHLYRGLRLPRLRAGDLTLNERRHRDALIGTQTNGQGHATAYAQFIAGQLGLDIDKIIVVQGDTDRLAAGGGTGGSRSIPLGAVSVDRAGDDLAEQLKAHRRRRARSRGRRHRAGRRHACASSAPTARSRFRELAPRPRRRRRCSTAFGEFVQAECTYPNGTPYLRGRDRPGDRRRPRSSATRSSTISASTVNPILLAGQVHGGVVQGIGQALYRAHRL